MFRLSDISDQDRYYSIICHEFKFNVLNVMLYMFM